MELNNYKINVLKKNLLSNYRTSLNSLVHIGLISHREAEDFVLKMDTIIYLKYRKEEEEKDNRIKEDFKKNNPSLVKEWEAYKPTQINNGVNLSLDFFRWLEYVKKIDYKKVKDEMKGGLKE